MTQKIGISVSDELHEKMQEMKGAFKISQVCQEALEEAVKRAILGKSKDIEALKLRLIEERKKLFKPYWEEGYEDGIKDAFSFSYSDVKGCLEFIDPQEGEWFTPFEYYASKETREKYDRIYGGDLPYSVELSVMDEDLICNEATEMYHSGWRDAVQSVLEQVKHL